MDGTTQRRVFQEMALQPSILATRTCANSFPRNKLKCEPRGSAGSAEGNEPQRATSPRITHKRALLHLRSLGKLSSQPIKKEKTGKWTKKGKATESSDESSATEPSAAQAMPPATPQEKRNKKKKLLSQMSLLQLSHRQHKQCHLQPLKKKKKKWTKTEKKAAESSDEPSATEDEPPEAEAMLSTAALGHSPGNKDLKLTPAKRKPLQKCLQRSSRKEKY